MPSTLFTAPPGWYWLVIIYFFVGGLAGGCFFLAALIDLFGRVEDRPVARLGYYVAFPAVVASGVLLIADLQVPSRFWHMLVESNTLRPMLKLYSPMSLGSWALLAFGAVAFAAFLAALADAGRAPWPWLRYFRPPGVVGVLVALVGGILGFFVAGYTGVLVAVTNQPIWSDTSLLGLNFLVSAASTSAALLILLAPRRWWALPGVHALKRFDSMTLVLELLALIALVVSLGSMARAWLNAWGAVLAIGVIGLGIIVPLALHVLERRRPAGPIARVRPFGRDLATPLAAALVLLGGFLFRVVIVLSAQGVNA
jgi:formate-dependent nitrite reductase membrane component NrfD